jgi:hypothetical protein
LLPSIVIASPLSTLYTTIHCSPLYTYIPDYQAISEQQASQKSEQTMFGGAANPYDDIIGQFQLIPAVCEEPELTSLVKATDENLASEDWALNIEVCDKVTGDGANG